MSDDPAGQVPTSPRQDEEKGLEILSREIVPALIARLRASRLGELEVRSGGWRVRLRRDPSARVRTSSGPSPAAADGDAPPGALGSVARSTAVGYFTPAPGLVVGAPVQAGDLLGTVDVLGIAQEVTAPTDGIVARVMAENGQAVEYGQALADIDPLELEADPFAVDGEEA